MRRTLAIALLFALAPLLPSRAAGFRYEPLDWDERVPHPEEGYLAWTPWMLVQEESGSPSSPSVATDSAAIAHVAWSAFNGSYGDIYYANTDWTTREFTGFSNRINVSNTTSASSYDADVAVNSSDEVCVVWTEQVASDRTDIYYRKRSTNATWTTATAILTGASNVYYSNAHVATVGTTMHVVALKTDTNESGSTSVVHYIDGTGASTIATLSGSAGAVTAPYDLAVSSGGYLATTWAENVTSGTSYARLGRYGTSWSTTDLETSTSGGLVSHPVGGGNYAAFVAYGWGSPAQYGIYPESGGSPTTGDSGSLPTTVTVSGPPLLDSRKNIIVGPTMRVRRASGAGTEVWGRGPETTPYTSTFHRAAIDKWDRVHATQASPGLYAHTYDPNLGAQSGMMVGFGPNATADVTNGNLLLDFPFFSDAGYGVPGAFGLYYNSKLHQRTVMGDGWTHAYQMTLFAGVANLGNSVYVTFPDGRTVVFWRQDVDVDGTWTTHPAFDFMARVQKDQPTTGEYTMQTFGGTKYIFNSRGKLKQIKDVSDNALTIAYAGGGDSPQRVQTITDTSGRTTQLDYQNGRLDMVQHTTAGGLCAWKVNYDTNGQVNTIEYDYNNVEQKRTWTLEWYSADDLANHKQKDYLEKLRTPLGSPANYHWEYTWYPDGSARKVIDPSVNLVTDDDDYAASPTSHSGVRILTYTNPAHTYGSSITNPSSEFKNRREKSTHYEYTYFMHLVHKVTNAASQATKWTYYGSPGTPGYARWRKPKKMLMPYGVGTSDSDKVTYEYRYGNPTGSWDTEGDQWPGLLREELIPSAFPSGGSQSSFTKKYTYTDGSTSGLYLVATSEDPYTRTTSYTYDSNGRLRFVNHPTVTLPNGTQSAVDETGYDASGRVSYVKSPGNRTVSNAYSHASGLPTTVTMGDQEETLDYEVDGKLKRSQKTVGSQTITTEYLYTIHGQVKRRTETGVSGTPYVEYTYDKDGNNTVEDPSDGATLNRAFDPLGRMNEVEYPAYIEWTYHYDREGALRRSTPPVPYSGGTNEGKTETKYDSIGRAASSRVLFAGSSTWLETVNTYDETIDSKVLTGFLTKSTVGSQDTKYVYDCRGNLEEARLPDNATVSHTCHDKLDRAFISKTVKSSTFQQGTFTRYDERGRVKETVSLADNVSCGNESPTFGPDDLTSQITRDPDDLVTKVADPLGRRFHMTYTPGEGLPDEVKDHNSITISKTLHENGAVSEQKVANSSGGLQTVASYAYNGWGKVASVTDAFSNDTVNTYNSRGLLTQTETPLGRRVNFTYTDDGLVEFKKIDEPGLNIQVKYEYDLQRRLEKWTVHNPASGTLSAVYKQTLNGAGQIVEFTYPDNSTEYWTYDSLGRLYTHTDLNSVVTTYSYDSLNRVSNETRTQSSTTLSNIDYQYTDAGQIKKVIQNAGTGTTVEYMNGSGSGYDVHGRLTHVSILIGATVWKKMVYAYDDSSNLISATLKNSDDSTDEALSYAYNNLNQLTQVSRSSTVIAQYVYDPAGRVLAQVLQQSIQTVNQYDAAGRLTRQTSVKLPGVIVSDLERVYDDDGLVVEEWLHHLGVHWEHDYDNAMRLTDTELFGNGGGAPTFTNTFTTDSGTDPESAYSTEVSATPGSITTVPGYEWHGQYDNAGNIAQWRETASGTMTTRTHNNRSQLTQETFPNGDKVDFVYDYQGNQTKEKFWPFGWTSEEDGKYKEIRTRQFGGNNEVAYFMLQTRTSDGDSLTTNVDHQYIYRGDWVRIAKQDQIPATHQLEWFVHHGANIWSEYSQPAGGSYTKVAVNVSTGTDAHLARYDVTGGTYSLYLNTAIGSTHRIVNSSGNILNQDLMTPWGKAIPGYSWTDGVANRYGLTGQERDKETASPSGGFDTTGEMHYRARAYSPRQMRFLQNDPPVERRPEAHYAYVSNNPVSSTDSSGLQDDYTPLTIDEIAMVQEMLKTKTLNQLGVIFTKSGGYQWKDRAKSPALIAYYEALHKDVAIAVETHDAQLSAQLIASVRVLGHSLASIRAMTSSQRFGLVFSSRGITDVERDLILSDEDHEWFTSENDRWLGYFGTALGLMMPTGGGSAVSAGGEAARQALFAEARAALRRAVARAATKQATSAVGRQVVDQALETALRKAGMSEQSIVNLRNAGYTFTAGANRYDFAGRFVGVQSGAINQGISATQRDILKDWFTLLKSGKSGPSPTGLLNNDTLIRYHEIARRAIQQSGDPTQVQRLSAIEVELLQRGVRP